MNRLPHAALLIVLVAVASCRKTISSQEEQPIEKLLLFHDHAEADTRRFGNFDSLAINQAMFIADVSKDAQPDSAYQEPGIYYEWQSLPATGCDSLVNYKGAGCVQAMFGCAGDYQVFASVYDSLTHEMVGNTDTVLLHVGTDTLVSFTPFKEGDDLRIGGGNAYAYPYESDSVYLWFSVKTTEPYSLFLPSATTYTDSISPNDFFASFTGITAGSNSYIYPSGKVTDIRGGAMQIPFYAADNNIKNLHITYQGNTYTGTIERTTSAYLIHWNYSGGVVFSVSQIKR